MHLTNLLKCEIKNFAGFDKLKIIDLTRIVAGPYCTMILGDLGAKIIKIESLNGDETRRWPPNVTNGNMSSYFSSLNRNKLSICINLKTSKGQQIVKNLVKYCDVLVENYVPGKLDSLGLGYDHLKELAPELIYCSITGFGSTGPYKNRPGYDVIAASIGGMLHITGPKDGEPCKPGVAMTDISTGLYAYGSILAALLNRQLTGKGQRIECNLFSTQLACLINIGSNYLNSDQEGCRWGTAHESIVPYESFRTNDGYFTVGAGSNSQFKSLCQLLNTPQLIDDERFVDNASRVQNRVVLIGYLKKKFLEKTNEEWMTIFKTASFPCGPVNKISEVFKDKHVKEIGLVKQVKLQSGTDVKMVGPPVNFSTITNCVRRPPPELGEHSKEILTDILGYDSSTINTLIKDGHDLRTVTLTLKKPRNSKKVKWSEGTVDNENMNKKKSKCCCIYQKPKKTFDESSSDDSDDECENCYGHVEKRQSKNTPET